MHKNIFVVGLIIILLGGTLTLFTYETSFVELYDIEVEKEREVPYQTQVEKTRQFSYKVIEDKEETLLELDLFSIDAGEIYLEYIYIPIGRDVVMSFESNDVLNLWILNYDEGDEYVKSGYIKEPENPLVKKTGVKKAEVGFHTSISDRYVFVLKNQHLFENVDVYYAKIVATWKETVTENRTETYTETELKYKTDTYYETETRQRTVTKYMYEILFGTFLLQSEISMIFTITSITGLAITIIGASAISNPSPQKMTSARFDRKPDKHETIRNDTIKYAKIELEKERLNEMLKTFKGKFDKNKIDEDIYTRLKIKYERELEKLE